jgi:hypothetical protein
MDDILVSSTAALRAPLCVRRIAERQRGPALGHLTGRSDEAHRNTVAERALAFVELS